MILLSPHREVRVVVVRGGQLHVLARRAEVGEPAHASHTREEAERAESPPQSGARALHPLRATAGQGHVIGPCDVTGHAEQEVGVELEAERKDASVYASHCATGSC